MDPPWPRLGPGDPVASAARLLRERGRPALLVCAGERLLGVLTEGDISRRAAFRVAADTPLSQLMSSPVASLRSDDYLFQAIARLRRQQLQRMPVLDAAGSVVGGLDLAVALAAAQPAELALIERLGDDDSLSGLARMRAAQPELVVRLLAEGVPAGDIQSLLSHLHIDLHRRVVERQLAAMAAQGWGAPPLDFEVLVMGAVGRDECALAPDQDNGLLLADYPDARHAAIDAWFAELATRLCDDLHALGVPRCRGHVMASNPLWRKSLSQWRAQLDGWLRRPSPVHLRLADIFFDFAPACGDGALSAALRSSASARARGAHRFVQEMLVLQDGLGVALGGFRRHLASERSGVHRGQINLKYHGLLPLVAALRLLALRNGVEASGSRGRLAALRDAGQLEAGEYEALSAARECLTGLQLRRQVTELHAGRAADNWLPLGQLSRGERDRLRAALRDIDDFQRRVRGLISGDVFA